MPSAGVYGGASRRAFGGHQSTAANQERGGDTGSERPSSRCRKVTWPTGRDVATQDNSMCIEETAQAQDTCGLSKAATHCRFRVRFQPEVSARKPLGRGAASGRCGWLPLTRPFSHARSRPWSPWPGPLGGRLCSGAQQAGGHVQFLCLRPLHVPGDFIAPRVSDGIGLLPYLTHSNLGLNKGLVHGELREICRKLCELKSAMHAARLGQAIAAS